MDVNEAHLAQSGQALTDRSFRAKSKIAAGRRAYCHRFPDCRQQEVIRVATAGMLSQVA